MKKLFTVKFQDGSEWHGTATASRVESYEWNAARQAARAKWGQGGDPEDVGVYHTKGDPPSVWRANDWFGDIDRSKMIVTETP